MKHRKKIVSIVAIVLAIMMFLPLLLNAFAMSASAASSSQIKKELDAL